MATRMRVVAWEVKPLVMADDGDDLTPVDVNPVRVAAKDWEGFKTGGDLEALKPIQEQIESDE